MTFVDLHDVLQDINVEEDVEEDVVTLPPQHRCASLTANLISCSDVDKWLLPTLEILISKTLDLKSGLQILGDLPEAVVKARASISSNTLNTYTHT